MTAQALAAVEPGDVPARRSAVCSHGVAGYCWDDAEPAEREAVEFLHGHAFAWAMLHDGDRDTAEAFAAWTVADSWRPGVVMLDGSHAADFARFTAGR